MKSYTIAISLLLSLPAQHICADEVRYYDIELIVFESTDLAARQTEAWGKKTTSEPPLQVVELDQPYPGPIPAEYNPKLTFKLLPASQAQLAEDKKLLIDSAKYNILLHQLWRQPGMSAEIALPVHIHQQYLVRKKYSGSNNDPDMPAVNLPTAANLDQSRSILDGYIKIILSRYLHAEVDLTYTTGLPMQNQSLLDQGSIEGNVIEPIVYRLKQTRKMRSKEVHYLDHPVLGVIILATPYLDDELKATSKQNR